MDVDLADRVAELEERARRFVLATTGSEGWQNYIQLQLLDERQHFNDLLTEVIAQFERQILDEVKAMLDQVLATRVRGTYQASASYARGDVVALDGGSFLARRDDPGKCPGDSWQLMARQGSRGVAGERGPPGKDAPRIDRWIVDRAAFTVTPVYSDGIFGPALELRELLAPEDNAAR